VVHRRFATRYSPAIRRFFEEATVGWRYLTGLAVIGPALLGTTLFATPALAARDTLTIGVAQFPSNMHPAIEPTVVKSYVRNMALRQLTGWDKDWKLGCILCTELPTIENGLAKIEDRPDGSKGMAVTFKLPADLKWADGVPVTAKDVVFSWELGKNPEASFTKPDVYTRVEKMEVPDDHTVIMHLKTIRSDYNDISDFRIVSEHVEAPVLKSAGSVAEWLKQTAYNRAPTTPGLWNGPFMITGYVSGSQIVLERNPQWPGKQPGFKKIVVKVIENTTALQANLLSGDIDYTPGEGIGLNIDQVIELEKTQKAKFDFIYKPALTYEHIDLKAENPFLKDVRVRHALLYAIDRKSLTDKLFEGKQPVADSFVNKLHPFYAKETPVYNYDPAKAKALLEEAGWKPGPDGIRRNAKGDRLSFDFQTTAGNKLRELIQQVLQSQWKDAGIDVVIKNEPARTLFGPTLSHREFTGLALYGWTSGIGDSPTSILASVSIPNGENGWGGSNYPGYANPEFDKVSAAIETELDPAKRAVYWATAQKLYAEDLPVLPLFFRAEPYAIPKWLKGLEPTGHSDGSTNWVENWYAAN
jgi:peptide/nickel transport system substrate-binding protein